jgi:hypothetical protein
MDNPVFQNKSDGDFDEAQLTVKKNDKDTNVRKH